MDTLDNKLKSAETELSTFIQTNHPYKDWLYRKKGTIETIFCLAGIVVVFSIAYVRSKGNIPACLGITYLACLIGGALLVFLVEIGYKYGKRLSLTTYFDTRKEFEAKVKSISYELDREKDLRKRKEKYEGDIRKREEEKRVRQIELEKRKKERTEEHKQRTLVANEERRKALIEDLKIKQEEENASTKDLNKAKAEEKLNPNINSSSVSKEPTTTFIIPAEKIVIPEINNETIKTETTVEEQGKSFTEIFTPKIPNKDSQKTPTASYLPKQNHLELQEKRNRIGELGEKIALEFEQRRFARLGFDLSRIEQISLTNDAAGYDIKSLDSQGHEIFIEVKSTTGNGKEPFFVSELELYRFMNEKNYWIYRVHSLNLDTGKGLLFIIDKKEDLEYYFDIKPIQYKFSPKK